LDQKLLEAKAVYEFRSKTDQFELQMAMVATQKEIKL
jgi:hypothetical protein